MTFVWTPEEREKERIKNVEANAFAAELLMPRRLILQMLAERPDITARELAEIFQVEEVEMTWRLIRIRTGQPTIRRTG